MLPTLDSTQQRFIRTETIIATVLSGVLPATVMWFLFEPLPMPLWGAEGFAAFLAKTAIGMGVVMTLIMTLVTRARIRGGGAPAGHWAPETQPLLRLAPRRLLLRAPLYALLALTVFAPLGLLAALMFGLDPVDRPAFVAFNLVYGAAIGFTLTPMILLAAMTDEKPAVANVAL